jgi:hypothetical protein
VFTRLTVLERGPNGDPSPGKASGSTRWWCECICGTKKLVRRDSLLKGSVKSCGCLLAERRMKADRV